MSLKCLLILMPVVLATAEQKPAVEFIHTGDWQSGDNVSFTIRGMVVDDRPEATGAPEQRGEFTGYVVEVSDPKGKKSKIPWAPLLRMAAPVSTGYLTAALLDPKGKRVAASTIPVLHKNYPTAVTMLEPPAGNVAAPPLHQAGRLYRIVSPRGTLNGDGRVTKLIARRENGPPVEYQPLAESPHSAIFSPATLQPGPHVFTVQEGSKFEEEFRVHVLGIRLDTSRIYKVGQKGTLVVEVTGFPTGKAELHGLMGQAPLVTVVNKKPAILAFTDEPQRLARKLPESEFRDGKWALEIAVLAVARGQFEITSTVSTLGYVNSGTARPPLLFKGPDPGDAKPPEQPGGDAAKPPSIPQPKREREKMCGPDITDNYILHMKLIKRRILQWRKEIDSMGSEKFMRKNGMRMDYWVGSTDHCPLFCDGTLTFAGLCVLEGITNDIMYGYIGRMLDLDLVDLIAAADVQEVLAQGNVKGKPAHKVAGYSVGYDLAREADITVDVFRRLLETVFVSTGSGPSRRAIDLVTEGCQDCSLCPEKRGAYRDFSTEDWVLK